MEAENKTKEQLIRALTEQRRRIFELETAQSEHERSEEGQTLAVRILEGLNRPIPRMEVIREILALVKGFTGFEAIGIRLRDGEDFPYFTTIGFPARFVEAERYLCARDRDGEIVRDPTGNPYMECMCGNILCGRIDPALPFFTEGGSFWSNNTSRLLATTSDEDRQTRTRNRCNGEGYESVALIPLYSDDEIIGLLQLNDTRTDRFTPGMIRFFEGIGAGIGIALKRRKTEEALVKYTAELARSNSELEQFAYVASHDLQEPLRMISSYVQLLEQRYKGKLDEDADDFIKYAVDGAKRMQDLINALLTYSRVGKVDKAFTPTDCESVLDKATSNLSVAIEESGAIVIHEALIII